MDDNRVEDNYLYQSRAGRLAGWLILTLGMIVPGVLLLINVNFWTTTQNLHTAFGFSPWVVSVLGALLLFAGLFSLLLRSKSKDVPYVVGMVFYTLIMVANVINLLQGIQVGALFLAPLLIVWVYYLGILWTRQRRERRLRDPRGD